MKLEDMFCSFNIFKEVIIKLFFLNMFYFSRHQYKFDAFYELGSLAVVNVRDLGNVKYAFKLLAFPDTRILQCKNNQVKVKKQKQNLKNNI